jgi:xanthine/CO dehydrogenase XdhC/CoxF family maturation factor
MSKSRIQRGPISGIGAESLEEIVLAIMAEIVAAQHNKERSQQAEAALEG